MATVTISNRTIFPILLVNFIGALGYSIVLPFLVVLVLDFGGNELIYGLLGATYSFFQLIGAPVLGRWSDNVGRRKILLLSQIGTFIAWVIFLAAMLSPHGNIIQVDNGLLGVFVLTVPLLLMFIARALDGITGGNISVANAYLADISSEETRKKNFGMMSASSNLGFILGPSLAGLLGSSSLGYTLPVIMAMLISLVAIFVIYFLLKEVNTQSLNKAADPQQMRKLLGVEQKECHEMKCETEVTFLKIMGDKKIGSLIVMYFLIFLAFNFFYVSFPIHAVQALEWSLFRIGIFFTIMSGVMVLVQGPLLHRLSKKVSDRALFLFGNVVLAVGFFLFTLTSEYYLWAGVVLFATGNGLMWPSFLAILAASGSQSIQGLIQGYASSAGSLASILGLIIGGTIYSLISASIFLIPAGMILLIVAYGFVVMRE